MPFSSSCQVIATKTPYWADLAGCGSISVTHLFRIADCFQSSWAEAVAIVLVLCLPVWLQVSAWLES